MKYKYAETISSALKTNKLGLRLNIYAATGDDCLVSTFCSVCFMGLGA